MEDPFYLPLPLAKAIQPITDTLSLSTLPLHIHELIFAWVFYHIIFSAISPLISAWLFPAVYTRLSARAAVDWNTHLTSLIQCCLISTLALFVVCNDSGRDAMDWADRIWGYSSAVGLVQALAAGYFLWDLTVSIMHFDALGPASLLHAISAFAVTVLGFRPFANYYGLSFILYEISNPFMNIQWFLKKLGKTGSKVYVCNGVLFLTTFFIFRILWGSYQSICMYSDMWTALQALEVNHEKPRATILPLWLAIVYLGGNTMLVLLNFYWFSLIVRGFMRHFGSAKKEMGRTQEKQHKQTF